jgi:hypothetical protein
MSRLRKLTQPSAVASWLIQSSFMTFSYLSLLSNQLARPGVPVHMGGT